MDRECIILAGGLGTRLRSELPKTPKVLAPVAGHPFLFYVLKWLQKNSVTRAVLSLGYKSDEVIDWCSTYDGPIELRFSIESEPLGTGGAIYLAMGKIQTKQFFLINGDTLFDVDLTLMEKFHRRMEANITIALKPLKQFDRYGVVNLDKQRNITGFAEKGFHKEGLINGGIYLIEKKCLQNFKMPDKFSFEKKFLEVYFSRLTMVGFIQNTYFIDIGVPNDYQRAQKELKNFITD